MSSNYGPRILADELVLCVDPNNIKSWSYNVHPNPIDIRSWATAPGNNCTVSRDPTVTDSPANGTPLKMVVTSSDPHIGTTNTYLTSAAQGETWTVSVYARANTETTGELYILGLNSSNSWVEAQNLTINIKTDWQRFSFTATLSNVNTVGIAIRLDGPNSGFATDGITVPTIWWDGIQVEKNSSATQLSLVSNPTRTSVFDLSLLKNNCSFVGNMTHNRSVTPPVFNTNATATNVLNHISTPTINLLDQTGYTLDFWVKLRPNASVTYHSLTGQLAVTPWLSIYANTSTGDSWYLSFRETGGTYRNFSSITDWNIQTNWTNIVITLDSDRVARFYLNGIERQSISTITNSFMRIVTLMGGYSSGGNYYVLQGSLGMAKVYTKTLSATEVKGSFASVRSRFYV